jgi:hypothetical protein
MTYRCKHITLDGKTYRIGSTGHVEIVYRATVGGFGKRHERTIWRSLKPGSPLARKLLVVAFPDIFTA